ncbi:hypothetical protein BOX15_Mlig001226g3, partial [Macrostomum lignano]
AHISKPHMLHRCLSGLAKRSIIPRLVVMQLDEATSATSSSNTDVRDRFKSLFTPNLQQLSSIFAKHGFELRLAGGAVRDLLMSKTPHDLDFATTATPEEMVSMFNAEGVRMINSNGLAHGTVTARIGDAENFEVTTLRIDRVTDGRHAIVEFTRDWALDASRRDLTINAMFLDLEGQLYDYFNGRNDLATRRVRFVGDAGDRIREDYLRILRYFRFHGRIAERRLMPISVADEADKETLAAVAQNAAGLGGIAGERIWVELKQILAGRRPDDLIGAMASCGVCAFIGLPAEPNVQELGVVLNRLPLTPTMSEYRPVPAVFLAALLRSNDELETAHARLKFSNEELGVLRFVLEHRGAALALVDNSVEEQRDFYQDLAALTSGKDPRTKQRVVQLLLYTGQAATLLPTISQWWPPKFPVNGHSILSNWRLSIAGKGPILGQIIDLLRLEWRDSRYTADEATLLREEVRVRVLTQLGQSTVKRSNDSSDDATCDTIDRSDKTKKKSKNK